MEKSNIFLIVSIIFTFCNVQAVSVKIRNEGKNEVTFALVDTIALKNNFSGGNLKYFYGLFKEWKLWGDLSKYMKVKGKDVTFKLLKRPQIALLEKNIKSIADTKNSLVLRVGDFCKIINFSQEYSKDNPYSKYFPKHIQTIRSMVDGVLSVKGKDCYCEYLLKPLQLKDASSIYNAMHALEKEKEGLGTISGGKRLAMGTIKNLEGLIKKYKFKHRKIVGKHKKDQLMVAILIIENIKKEMNKLFKI